MLFMQLFIPLAVNLNCLGLLDDSPQFSVFTSYYCLYNTKPFDILHRKLNKLSRLVGKP